MKTILALAIVAVLASPVLAVSVALELELLADVSGSVSTSEFTLQRTGYANAFRSATVHSAIASQGPIAVRLTYWGTNQHVAVNWTLISDATSANAFADAIDAAGRPESGSTYMANAINFAVAGFATNNFQGQRQVIDISGDGTDNAPGGGPSSVLAARDNAFTAGIDTINALWIGSSSLLTYGQNYVIGGPGAFQDVVSNFADFSAAIEQKIGREITNPPIPEPVTLISVLAGSSALMGYVRRRHRAAA